MNNINNRIAVLSQMGEQVFHVDDLQKIWNIKEKNTLHTTLKRYVDKGILYRIYRGLYSLIPPEQIDSWLLGAKAIHGFCYVSTETVLARAGIIQQDIQYITLVSSQSSKFRINGYDFYSRQLKDRYLFQDAGIHFEDGVRVASPARAVADMLYYDPKYFFDNQDRINRPAVRQIQKLIGYPAANRLL